MKTILKNENNKPFKSCIDLMCNVEIINDDIFKENNFIFLGMEKKFKYYENIKNFPDSESVGFNINYNNFINLGICAGSGTGKTQLTKNIILGLYKAGYKILIFSPKNDEWTVAKKPGKFSERIHPNNKNEGLPIKSYVPLFVKDYMKDRREYKKSDYTFYSHSINSFRTIEAWESLGFTQTASKYCSGMISEGRCKSIDDVKNSINKSNLMSITKRSAIATIESFTSLNYINDKFNFLDLEKDFEEDKIVVINYFSQEGSLMSADISLLVEKARQYGSKYNSKKKIKPIIILFEDANYFADPSKVYNEASIKSILSCQVNYRSYGINPIITYQFPEVVTSVIRKGSKSMFVSFLMDPRQLQGSISQEAYEKLVKSEKEGGIIVKPDEYLYQWIFQKDGKEFITFYPEACRVGHKF